MDSIAVEAKTYEDAVRKAAIELGVDEKDLDIDVKEVDTKGILGLLGSKKIRITARIKGSGNEQRAAEKVLPQVESEVAPDLETPEAYGDKFLREVGSYVGLSFEVKVTEVHGRIAFLVQAEDGDVLIGKDGETLEALQYTLRLAIAKRFKEGLKILVDINGYREKRRKALTVMAKRLADKVKRTGRRLKTDPLNPYERRIIHTLFKHNKNITTKSEGEGHTKKVVISLTGRMNGRQ
jgi:spoIIIJ-associated protein